MLGLPTAGFPSDQLEGHLPQGRPLQSASGSEVPSQGTPLSKVELQTVLRSQPRWQSQEAQGWDRLMVVAKADGAWRSGGRTGRRGSEAEST